jgi:hypothetical protein
VREEIYTQLKATNKDFDNEYTAVVPLTEIVYNRQTSQIRSTGHVLSNVPAYTEVFRSRGPRAFPPASVKRRYDDKGNVKYELMDGNTRALAAESAKKDLLISWYHDAVHTPNKKAWEDLQVYFNDHPRSSPNASKDIKDYISRQQQNGQMTLKVGFSYDTDEVKYVETAVEIYRTALPNTAKNKDWWRRVIKNSLKGQVGVRYETWTKNNLFSMYKTTAKFKGEKIGGIANGEVVFPFLSLSHCNPNVIGFIASKAMKNPEDNLKYTLIFAIGDLYSKNDAKIKKARATVVDWVEDMRAHYNWSINVYFAPQIKTGPNKEQMWAFIDEDTAKQQTP